MTGVPRYDSIGVGYTTTRRPIAIARQIDAALGASAAVVNVGAGTGNYEPADRVVVAVEPSAAMIGQRSPGTAPVVRATAEHLPFPRGAFGGAMAVLTVHHWSDPTAGLAELRRVSAGPVVVLTFDHVVHSRQWLVTDYLPEMIDLDDDVPPPETSSGHSAVGSVAVVPVPVDCLDGFCHAYWARPEAYLDPAVRAGISGIARLPRETVAAAMARLGGRPHDRAVARSTPSVPRRHDDRRRLPARDLALTAGRLHRGGSTPGAWAPDGSRHRDSPISFEARCRENPHISESSRAFIPSFTHSEIMSIRNRWRASENCSIAVWTDVRCTFV